MTRSLMAVALFAVLLLGCEETPKTPQAEAQDFLEAAAACVEEQRDYLLELIVTRPQDLESLGQEDMVELCRGLSIDSLSDEARVVVVQTGEAVGREFGKQLMEALVGAAFSGGMTEADAASLFDALVSGIRSAVAGIDVTADES